MYENINFNFCNGLRPSSVLAPTPCSEDRVEEREDDFVGSRSGGGSHETTTPSHT